MTPSKESAEPAKSDQLIDREKGLSRQLSARQLTMIALGGAIGTGLFLGTGLSVPIAGPAIIITYAIGAFVALLLMGVLSEMAVVHPTAGSFGVYAEIYVNPWAGFSVRYAYWFAQVVAVGSEVVAASIYMQKWIPREKIHPVVWVILFSIAMVYVNARSVGNFGEFEYWFAMIKVVTIVAFIVIGSLLIFGIGGGHAAGIDNFKSAERFFPHGIKGVWIAIPFVIFSYIGTEIIAVTAGEAKDPAKAIPKALRTMVGRLIIFYIGSIAVLLALLPADQIGAKESPFVHVFETIHIPGAEHLMNFVVLTATLSSVNTNLYLTTRMMFSLSRAGYAPATVGKVSKRGVPLRALLVSTGGLAVAVILTFLYKDTETFSLMIGIALFGALFVWLMIFVTHLFFRPAWVKSGRPLPIKMIGYPYSSYLGIAVMLAIIATTRLTTDASFNKSLLVGLPFLVLITIAYFIRRWKTGQPG
ncbi:MAG TPA: amino acid permease [Blastocatellia bacterium]|nr:amino acid permease [Blastocatellia bacterium]